MVSSNMIRNCSITPSDIANAKEIFGSALASVQGETVHHTPTPVVGDYIAVPCSLVKWNRIITMAADVFFVDGTAFLITLSRNVKFITAEHTPVRTAKALVKHIEGVLQVYRRAGFIVRTILMDGEFEKNQRCITHCRVQYHRHKRRHEQSRKNNQNGEGEDKRTRVHAAVHAHPMTNENRVHLFHGVLAECLPSEDGNLWSILPPRIVGAMAPRLQQALQSSAGNIL